MAKKLYLYCDELGRQPDVSSSVSFPLQYYYDGNKFAMLNGFTLTKTIWQKIWEKPHPIMQAKSLLKPLKVEAHRSKNDFT